MLRDLVTGRRGLGETFWLWGVGGFVLILGARMFFRKISENQFSIPEAYQATLFNTFEVMAAIWLVTVLISVVSAIRRRPKIGFKGPLACFVMMLLLVPSGLGVAKIVGIMPPTWSDIEAGVRAENAKLPVDFDSGLTLTNMVAFSPTRSIWFTVAYDPTVIDLASMTYEEKRDWMLSYCPTLELLFGPQIESLKWFFNAPGQESFNISVRRPDCQT